MHRKPSLLTKRYDSDALVASINNVGAVAVIPPRSNCLEPRTWDRHRYRARHLIENLFARLKQFRRLATRYDKLTTQFAGFVMLASLSVGLA
jgi:transposase